MRAAIENGINTMETNLHKAKVLAATYIAFVDMIQLATHRVCNSNAGNLGTFATFLGHHHIQWAMSCQKTFRKPICSPGQKPYPTKSPFKMSVLLIEECWRLVESIWEARNTILHGTESYTAQAENSRLFRELLDYKRRQRTLLHHGDIHHISFPVGDIAGWDRKKKKRVIRLLDSLHRIFVRDNDLAAEHHKKLTDYGFSVTTQDDESSVEA